MNKIEHEIQYNERGAIVAYQTVRNNGNVKVVGLPVVEEINESAIYCVDCGEWLSGEYLTEHGINEDWEVL